MFDSRGGVTAGLLALLLAGPGGAAPGMAQGTPRQPIGSAYCALLSQAAAAALAAHETTTAADYGEALKQHHCAGADVALPPAQPSAGPPEPQLSFSLISDQLPTTGAGPRLCLVVDAAKPLTVPRYAVGAGFGEGAGGAAGAALPPATFYPVVVQACGLIPNLPRGPDTITTWTVTDTRELRATVKGAPMCLSGRYGGSFNGELIAAYLAAFGARSPGSPFAYLAGLLDPAPPPGPPASLGVTPAGRALSPPFTYLAPPLVAAPCGLGDGEDFFTYDDLTGTVSGPGGFLPNLGGQKTSLAFRKCVAILGDPTGSESRWQTGMPVYAADCDDITGYTRLPSLKTEHWTATTGGAGLPTYRQPDVGDYFSGLSGLPITGPLGRCLTRDSLTPTAVTTADCDGRQEQLWKAAGGTIQFGASSDCLTADPGGAATVSPCVAGAADQQWAYDVPLAAPAMYTLPNPTPATAWTQAWAYGQIHPAGAPTQCLAVTQDPFADPILQRNPVAVAGCAAVLPRQASWFRPTRVRTVRIGLLRYANDDGSAQAMAPQSDAAVLQTAQALATLLSHQYQALGVRFVVAQDSDLLDIDSTLANTYETVDWMAANRVTADAADKLYGRLAIALSTGISGGEFASGNFIEYDPFLIFDPIIGTSLPVTSTTQLLNDYQVETTVPNDPAGLPALSYFAGTDSISAEPVNLMPHEIGHYLGLQHTFNPDEFLDTPTDTGDGAGWITGNAYSTCGNLRTGPVTQGSTATVTPDRNDNESYWGCMVGRAHASFSPLQLARVDWALNNQMNRYPLVACQPTGDYDADHVECETAASLALCQQTSAYLKAAYYESVDCQRGGRYTRMIAGLLADVRVQQLLATPAGQALIRKLAGQPDQAKPLEPQAQAVAAALKDCTILPVTMAVANRLDAFVLSGASPTPAVAAAVFNQRFIDHVPALLP
jgi:hypothetical protein